MSETRLGLRIDVDTLRGTRLGTPALVQTLGRRGLRASFFFSVGPDNMGRNLYRLLRPAFLKKMLRSAAPSLYGWDILLMGTLGPGPLIHQKAGDAIAAAAAAGHEVCLHAWDHFTWQNRLDRLPDSRFAAEFDRAFTALSGLIGRAPVASANPAWRCTDAALRLKEQYPFAYNSDCRGPEIFLPLIGDTAGRIPQVPTTMPTFDEVIGSGGVTMDNFNDHVLGLIQPGRLNVYTIHAEVEGIACREMFERLLDRLAAAGIKPVALGDLVAEIPEAERGRLPVRRLVERAIPGREGRAATPEIP
jgi:undecaprenyl phosphate-alpha-L-ara4FN deformylase